jgi:hypothetical protein
VAGGTVTFQAQNPAISGDRSTHLNARGVRVKSGWSNCTAFVAAMGAQFDSGVRLTGTQVRKQSNEPVPDSRSPGLSLSQVAAVLKRHGIRIDVQTPIDFDRLDVFRRAGHAIALQLSYAPIRHTKFTGDPAFDGGHIVLWLPNGDVYDPLNDHRRPGIARAPVRMPASLLRQAAGNLIVNAAGGRVGVGRAYAAIFPTVHRPGQKPGTKPPKPRPPSLAFGAKKPHGTEFRVVVPIALVRTKPGGVPGKGNVVGRLRRGARVPVFGTTSQGQRVGGSRVWHQVDRAGRRFMHSSVIDPI